MVLSGSDAAADSGLAWEAIDRGQVPTHAEEGSAEVIERLAAIGRDAVKRWPSISTIGIGVPGPYDPSSGATRSLTNFPGDWEGVPVAPYVGLEVGGVPAYLINDARAFGLAELRLGAGRGASSMVGLTLGTGLGGVFAINGRVHQGLDGAAGELGHQTIDTDGPPCNCGNVGCLEAFVRADVIEAAAGAASMEEVVERARAGEAQAVAALTDAARYLGIGIGNVVTLLTPDRVVIGGGVAAALDLLLPVMWEEMRKRVFMTRLDTVEIVPAELGVWAGAIGAAIHGAEAASQSTSDPG